MIEKKINGAWTACRDVQKKVDGVWSDCTSIRRMMGGTVNTTIWSRKSIAWRTLSMTSEYKFPTSTITTTQTTATIKVATPKKEGSNKLSIAVYYTTDAIPLQKNETLYIEYAFTPSHVSGASGFLQLSCSVGLGSIDSSGNSTTIADAVINAGTGVLKLKNPQVADTWQIWFRIACSQDFYAPAYNATLEINRIYSSSNIYYWG